MALTGICSICSKPAMYTCSFCGKTVCIECYNKPKRVCVRCHGQYGDKLNDDNADPQEILF